MYKGTLALPQRNALVAAITAATTLTEPACELTAAITAITSAAIGAVQQYENDTAAERQAVLKEVAVHSARVALYTWCLARAVELDGRRVADRDVSAELLAVASLFHDIGKVAVPASLLAKPGRLTPEELLRVQTHTLLGARMIDGLAGSVADPLRRLIAKVCECHHERWDGSGYPCARSGRRIPYGARLVAICDTYDAIVHDRVYAKSRSHATAMRILSEGRAVLFDPDVVDVMLSIGSDFLALERQIR
ncbi:HD-GYP domain-containing protein [Paraburkholderia sp. J76]|uniref:HD-GYP domain-containing protein n=1 Tax=Paraburkholderia sp. J76 TaxID=2805439 RepID=UPI002ABD75EC|nr:HD domain-containing phosphohydrolase [Paraburkholderia sp. J76]